METGYYFGLSGENRVKLYKRNHDIVELAEADFPLAMEAIGDELRCFINDREVLAFTDENPLVSGMTGTVKLEAGRTRFLTLSCREL